jgi:hypothetical protein
LHTVPFREKQKWKTLFFLLGFAATHLDYFHKHSPLPNTVAGPSGSAILVLSGDRSHRLQLPMVSNRTFTALTIPAFTRTL